LVLISNRTLKLVQSIFLTAILWTKLKKKQGRKDMGCIKNITQNDTEWIYRISLFFRFVL